MRLDQRLLVEKADGLIDLGLAHVEIVEGGVRDLNAALANELDVLRRADDADELHLILESGLHDRIHHDGGRGIRRIDPIDIRVRLKIADNHLAD
jgi:hypothetical protein